MAPLVGRVEHLQCVRARASRGSRSRTQLQREHVRRGRERNLARLALLSVAVAQRRGVAVRLVERIVTQGVVVKVDR